MNNSNQNTSRANVLGVGVSPINMPTAVNNLIQARRLNQTGYVCVTGAHGVIESQRNHDLLSIHNNSLFTMPDGMPTVWMGLEQGFQKMRRVYGPDLMLELCKATSDSSPNNDLTHFLYGTTDDILHKLKYNLERKYKGIKIVGSYAPPYRPLNSNEANELEKIVNICKPDFFWVGLSTPKQEYFMNQFSSQIDCGIMLGVGAAFPINAGLQKDASEWIKNSGFHWLYRLLKEPRRLWRRYLNIVPNFIYLSLCQILGFKKYTLD